MSEQSHEPTEAGTLHGAGVRLREARVAMGLTPEDIAARLYLRVTLIHDIENEQFERLPPAPFINGYLRNYAKLVGLSCDQVVSSCESGGSESSEITLIRSKGEVTSNSRSVKLVTWFIVLVLLVLLSVWWVSRQPVVEGVLGAGGADQSGDIVLSRSSDPVEPMLAETASSPPADEGERMPAPELVADTVELPAATAESVAETRAEGGSEGEAERELVVAEGDAPLVEGGVSASEGADAPAAAAPERVVATTPQSIAIVPKSLKAGEAQAELRLEMAVDCWTEVRDDAGRALYFNVAKAGTQLSLKGKAPFKLLLGNAGGSKVFLNGKPFAYSGAGVVRLTVGGKGDNQVSAP